MEIDPNSLCGEHFGYTISIETLPYVGYNKQEFTRYFLIKGPYCEPLVQRLRKAKATFTDNVWKLPVSKSAAMARILRDLDQLVREGKERDQENIDRADKLVGTYRKYLTVTRRNHLLYLSYPRNEHLSKKLKEIGAFWDKQLKLPVIPITKLENLEHVIENLALYLPKSQDTQTRRVTSPIEATGAKEMPPLNARAMPESTEKRFILGNAGSQAEAIDNAHQLYSQRLIDGEWWVLGTVGRPYREYDDDWSVAVTMVPASPEQQLEIEHQMQVTAAMRKLSAMARHWKSAMYPVNPVVEGRIIIDNRNIEGTGHYWAIGRDLWYVEQHGADGDDWSQNNLPGERAWYRPYDERLAQSLEDLALICSKSSLDTSRGNLDE